MRLTNGGTQEATRCALMDMCVQAVSFVESEMLSTIRTSCDADRNKVEKSEMSHCREKLLGSITLPVPQTDTGSRVENTKVSERTLVKELGKMTP